MRIVYLNPAGQMGGAETSLVDLLASIREAKPAWRLMLVLGAGGPLVENVEQLGVCCTIVPMPDALAKLGDSGGGRLATALSLARAWLPLMSYTRQLRDAVRQLKPDLIHAAGFKMQIFGARVRPPGVPLIWHIHDYVRRRPLAGRLLRFHRHRCDLAVVNSQSVAADVRALFGGRPEVVPLYNVVDLVRFTPEGTRTDLDAASGLEPAPAGTFRVGLVATFARWKGHETFLRALALLPRQLPVRGYVIGGPIYQTAGSQYSREELERRASELGLQGRIGFTGHLTDVPSAMRALDCVVHASTEPEPFGMVIIEAMACRRAVVAANAGGAVEIFKDGFDALGHPPGDAAALAGQITRLASDAELRNRLARQGRESVQTLFHRRRLAAELVSIYQRDLLATP